MAIGEETRRDDDAESSGVRAGLIVAAEDCLTSSFGGTGAGRGGGRAGGAGGGGVKGLVERGLLWMNGERRPKPSLETSVRFFGSSKGSSPVNVVGEGGVMVAAGVS
jgi:hypothetical protein